MIGRILLAALLASITGGGILITTGRTVGAQQPACLHELASETAPEKARRTLALQLARAINTAEARYSSSNAGKYGQLEQLPVSAAIPGGFVPALSTDGDSYAFSVKDKVDPCAFAYFSDQDGRIFQGEGIR